jgi:pimeloyl-ACP methyl ester carboxylesterase
VAEPPEIQYVNCGGRDLAYEVSGFGTAGFVVYLECGAHLDLMWTDPAWRQQAERFGELWRAAFFQMRGIGQSEPVERLPTLEEQAQDIATVMDAVGLERAWVYGSGATAPGAVVFAATHPDRVDGLVLLVPFLSAPLADDPDLTGWESGAARRWAEAWLEAADRWGTGVMVDGWDPAIASKSVYRQAALLERTSASRAVARAYIEAAMRTDVSRIAAQVQCPVRVLHNPTNPVPEAVSRHAAELFPAGQLVVLRPSEPGMSARSCPASPGPPRRPPGRPPADACLWAERLAEAEQDKHAHEEGGENTDKEHGGLAGLAVQPNHLVPVRSRRLGRSRYRSYGSIRVCDKAATPA